MATRGRTGRDELLAAGVAMVSERAVGEQLDQLRIRALAEQAGLTPAAFYHYWPDQAGYRRAVLDRLLEGDRSEAVPGFLDDTCDVDDPVTAVLGAAELTFEAIVTDPHERLMLALWAQRDEDTHRRLAVRSERAASAWASRLGHLLAGCGRRPVAPWGLEGLGRVTVALTDGLVIQQRTDAAVLRPRDGRHPAGLLALALLLGMTERGTPLTAPAPPPPQPTGPTPTAGETRLLQLGVDAALRRPVGDVLDHIRAPLVARRAGVTAGAFYHYWDSQESYRGDLVREVFSAQRYVDGGIVSRLATELDEAPDLVAATREATSWYWPLVAKHPDNVVQFGFTALGDPRVTPQLARVTVALREEWQTVVAATVAGFDRRLRPAFDAELLVLGMEATVNGLILQAGLGVEGLDIDGDGWTLWGRACAALIIAATVETAAEGPLDLPTHATEAFAS